MDKINAEEFLRLTKNNSSWAAELTKPLEVCGFLRADKSPITHLSPHLHFTGENSSNWSASFENCRLLTKAEGKFSGAVSFIQTGITEIGEIEVEMGKKESRGLSCTFFNCKQLKEARGKYKGRVYFGAAGIRTIGELECKEADFSGCLVEKIKGPIRIPDPRNKIVNIPVLVIEDYLRRKFRETLRHKKTVPEEMVI